MPLRDRRRCAALPLLISGGEPEKRSNLQEAVSQLQLSGRFFFWFRLCRVRELRKFPENVKFFKKKLIESKEKVA
ncbi:MAG: hypothetical protein L0Z53_01405, partial [Acidobacteriales bacterium]|nr:hypothetical protein [Terriglobales bacterium]